MDRRTFIKLALATVPVVMLPVQIPRPDESATTTCFVRSGLPDGEYTIFEFIRYDRALAPWEIKKVDDYLREKYDMDEWNPTKIPGCIEWVTDYDRVRDRIGGRS